jgi:hypothetical protein
LNADGNVVAIGAVYNDGAGKDTGRVHIYEWNTTTWNQRGAYIDGEASGDASGFSVSLNANGDVVAIGAIRNDRTGSNAGHVRIYEWNITDWNQLGDDIDGEAADDNSGYSVSLNAGGDIVAIGATGNDGNGTNAGHVRVYEWNTTDWNQLGDDIDGEAAGDNSGYSVSLNAVGNVVAVGARFNNTNGMGSVGHARVFQWNSTTWNQLGNDMDGDTANDWFGQSVSLNNDGDVIAIGVPGYDGRGISNSGAVHVYVLASDEPSVSPSSYPTVHPSDEPSLSPSDMPSVLPSVLPSEEPSILPSNQPSDLPSDNPSIFPSNEPSVAPSDEPSELPSDEPSMIPSHVPSSMPSDYPSLMPSDEPSSYPSDKPSMFPSHKPSALPSADPTILPSDEPSELPSDEPSMIASHVPSSMPSDYPSLMPSDEPSSYPSNEPSMFPSHKPSALPSADPTILPSDEPSELPSDEPSMKPSSHPSHRPNPKPTYQPTSYSTYSPSARPTLTLTLNPTSHPTTVPTRQPVAAVVTYAQNTFCGSCDDKIINDSVQQNYNNLLFPGDVKIVGISVDCSGCPGQGVARVNLESIIFIVEITQLPTPEDPDNFLEPSEVISFFNSKAEAISAAVSQQVGIEIVMQEDVREIEAPSSRPSQSPVPSISQHHSVSLSPTQRYQPSTTPTSSPRPSSSPTTRSSRTFQIISSFNFDDSGRDFCLNAMKFKVGGRVKMRPCRNGFRKQMWFLDDFNQLRLREHSEFCLTYRKREVSLGKCLNDASIKRARFRYDKARGIVYVRKRRRDLYLGIEPGDNKYGPVRLFLEGQNESLTNWFFF